MLEEKEKEEEGKKVKEEEEEEKRGQEGDTEREEYMSTSNCRDVPSHPHILLTSLAIDQFINERKVLSTRHLGTHRAGWVYVLPMVGPQKSITLLVGIN